jgi:hypothetical protein
MVWTGIMHKLKLNKKIDMEKLRELELSEMIQISGGTNVAYEVGYFIGNGIKKFLLLTSAFKLIG